MHSVEQIARALDGRAAGDASKVVGSVAEPQFAKADDIAVALSPTFLDQLTRSAARVALLAEGTDWTLYGLDAAVFVARGRLAMAGLTRAFDPLPVVSAGVHPSAIIDPEAQIGADVSIGPFVVIGAGCQVGAGSRIGSHVSVADGARIGAQVIIADGCRIGRNVSLGDRVQLQPNVVLGCDGFSYVTAQPAHVEIARKTLGEGAPPVLDDATWHKIHALGGVTIADDVEIGAGSTVDAGTLRPTLIGRGTKIDNLVHIGHNVIIGEDCLFCAQSGIAGSATVGDRTVVGGQAGIADNISIGADVVLGGGSGVLSNVPAGRVMLGYPATKMARHIESYQALRRLPRLLDRLKKQG